MSIRFPLLGNMGPLYIVTYSEGINCSNNPCVKKWLPICRVSMFNTCSTVVTYTEGVNCTRLVWLICIVTNTEGIKCSNNACVK